MTKNDIIRLLLANKEVLNKYKVKSIALFGSYVRNEQKKGSDIDFLVEFEEDTYNNFIHLIFELEDIFKTKVQVLTESDLSPYIRPYILKEMETIER